MDNESPSAFDSDKPADVRASAKKALLQLLEPLAGFVSDAGLSTGDVHAIFREVAVRSAAARQMETSGRINLSGIAATTGVSRADVSRILKEPPEKLENNADSQQRSTNRILAAWFDDPKFTAANGEPAELKLYGRGSTFETLARKYGRGLPVRAVLDELVRTGAVELLPNQRIRAKASMAVERGISALVTKAFGDRAAALMSTLLFNMRQPETPRFVASVAHSAIATASLPLLRRELSVKAADFLAEVQKSMPLKRRKRSAKLVETGAGISLTIFYHEAAGQPPLVAKSVARRRNFKRDNS